VGATKFSSQKDTTERIRDPSSPSAPNKIPALNWSKFWLHVEPGKIIHGNDIKSTKSYQNSKTVAKLNQPQNWGQKIEKHHPKTD